MTPLAAVVLAHTDPAQVRRLVRALEDIPVFLHCDARTQPAVFAEMVRDLPDRVTVCERRATHWASWSLVAAELAALRTALATTSSRHIAVMSGADYPLVPMAELAAELDRREGETVLWNVPLPYRGWSVPRHHDGGMWRLRRRFITRGDRLVYVRDIPLRWPVPRALPVEIEPRASMQWKIYARIHAEALVRIADQRPDLIRFWRTTLVPDESFVASTLASTALLGADALAVSKETAWYVDWSGPTRDHPRRLEAEDFPLLAAARDGRTADGSPRRPALFARKFSSTGGGDLLDRIDRELLRHPATTGP